MKKPASALALAALLAGPAAHAATAVDFNGEFEVNAYNLSADDADDDVRGLQQLLRLGANVKLDDGVQVVTRMNLANNTWTGDTRRTAVSGEAENSYVNHGGAFSPDAGDDVTLDLGYLQLPTGPGVLRIGRQESNWANCFVSCDDRRDRIQWAGRVGGFTAGAGFDKRAERALEGDDDSTGYYGFAVGKVGPALAGLLVYHTRVDEDAVSDPISAIGGATIGIPGADGSSTLVSPYFQTKLAGLELSGAAAYVSLDYDDYQPLMGGSAIEFDDQFGGYLRAGYDLGVAKVELQGVYSDKFNVNQGFDTFSSLLNNSPENNQSPTSVVNLVPAAEAGSIVQGDEAMLVSARVTGNVSKQLKLIGGAGFGTSDFESIGLVTGAREAAETDLQFFDLQAHYQLSASTLVWATAGRLTIDVDGGDETDVDALSLNVRTTF